MNRIFFSIITWSFVLLLSQFSWAAGPVLNFSDITSGPKTGIGDGLGSGAIVTIWGNQLVSSQGALKVYYRDSSNNTIEAAHVYYWKNADSTLPSGPADLYTYHKMQEISFSIPSGAADGAGSIYVAVDGITSNSLPFTIRPGNIKHVKTTGTDAVGCGSWASPCRNIQYLTTGGRSVAGDIIYAHNGVQDTDTLTIQYIDGTETNPISLIAYPGAAVLAQGTGIGIDNYNSDSDYWNVSKFVVKTGGTGIDGFKGARLVGNEVTNAPGLYANGQGGAISGQGNKSTGYGLRVFGNYIHDFGGDDTSRLHHVFYITNRIGSPMPAFELGWNYLTDNKAHEALHVFDEGICGDWTGTIRLHDNVVKNQVGAGVDVTTGGTDPCFTMPVEIYNNLFINVGLEIPSCSGHTTAVIFQQLYNHSHIRVYNNTIHGFGIQGSGQLLYVITGSYWQSFGGTWEWVNNIAVDTNNRPWEDVTYAAKPPTVHSNNLWFNGGDGNPASPPSWDTSPLTSNPLFVGGSPYSYALQQTSPARNAGTSSIRNVLRKDLQGGLRSNPFDIGAFNYSHLIAPVPPVLH